MSDAIEFLEITPILRIFDIAKADEFYLGFLGFSLDWEHRFDDDAPLASLRRAITDAPASSPQVAACPRIEPTRSVRFVRNGVRR